jgi:hypothetical protein
MLVADDWIDLIFTRGVYSAFPIGFSYDLNRVSGIARAVVP